jgi:hypothetical protein
MLERIQNDREYPLRPFTQEEIDVFNARELTPSEILENEFFDAMHADDFDKIEEILNKRVPNPEERLRVTKYRPSIRCLSECIWNLQKHQYINNPIHHPITYIKYKDLVMRLLSAPYFIKPDDTCLCYAIMNQEHDLIHMFVTRYRRSLNCNENTLQYAISACNVKMVRFLLFKYRVPIDDDLLNFIETDKQTEDDFPIEERRKRNIIIRRMIKKALREDHF